MNPDIQSYVEKSIQALLAQPGIKSEDMFHGFIEKCISYYDRPVSSLAEMRTRKDTKRIGDIFEHFCVKYLLCVRKFKEAWLLQDVPEDVLQKHSLTKTDLGIDIIAIDSRGREYAIQVKFRRKNKYKRLTVVGWKQLSTFYALVAKTGPWHKHLVMTNANCVRRVGKKAPEDASWCIKTFCNIKELDWNDMAGMASCGEKAGSSKTEKKESPEPQSTVEDIKNLKEAIKNQPSSQPSQIPEKENKLKRKLSKKDMELLRQRRLAFYGNQKTDLSDNQE